MQKYFNHKKLRRVFKTVQLEYTLRLRLRTKKLRFFDGWRQEAEWTACKLRRFKLSKFWTLLKYGISRVREQRFSQPLIKSSLTDHKDKPRSYSKINKSQKEA